MKIKQEVGVRNYHIKRKYNTTEIDSLAIRHVSFKRLLKRDVMYRRIAEYHSLLAPRIHRSEAREYFAKTNSITGRLENICALTHIVNDDNIFQSSVSNNFFQNIYVRMIEYIQKHAPELLTRGFNIEKIPRINSNRIILTSTVVEDKEEVNLKSNNDNNGPVDIGNYMKMQICEDNRIQGLMFVTWTFRSDEKGTAAVYAVYLHMLLFSYLSNDLFSEEDRTQWKYVISALRFQCSMLDRNGEVMWAYLTGDGEGKQYQHLMHRKLYKRHRDENGQPRPQSIQENKQPSLEEYKIWVSSFSKALFIKCERFGAPMKVKLRTQ